MEEVSASKTAPHFEVSLGKILLGNWVEERQVAHIDNEPKTIKELHVEGHTGVLTQTENMSSLISTSKDSYKKPETLTVRNVGRRRELLEKQLYEKLSSELHQSIDASPPPLDFTSTTKKDFHKDYTPIQKEATMRHDVNTEMPVTFWNQSIQKIDGVTQQQVSPFNKNAAFSTPIHEYKDSPKPGEEWNY